jgi:hypothetical protein
MTTMAKKFLFWGAVLVAGIAWATVLDFLLCVAPILNRHGYNGSYDAGKLCDLVKPGMSLGAVGSLAFSLGKPLASGYLEEYRIFLVTGNADECYLKLAPDGQTVEGASAGPKP